LEEEEREKVTERGCLSPFGRGREREGNRERLSEPVWKRKREER